MSVIAFEYIRARDIARTFHHARLPVPVHLANTIADLTKQLDEELRNGNSGGRE